jgi:hypothetical protein
MKRFPTPGQELMLDYFMTLSVSRILGIESNGSMINELDAVMT